MSRYSPALAMTPYPISYKQSHVYSIRVTISNTKYTGHLQQTNFRKEQ